MKWAMFGQGDPRPWPRRGWKGRGPPPGRYADADRPPEVAAPRTWLLSKGWRRIGLVNPSEVPGR